LHQEQQTYECDKCKDAGFVYDSDTNTSWHCECWKAKQYKRLYEKSGISQAFANKTFDNYKISGRPQIVRATKQIAMSYTASYDGSHSIAFLGQVGAGKTHLCIAIANELMQHNVGVLYMQYREVITHLKQNMLDEEFYQKALSGYKTAPVLFIDDLYKGATRNGRPNESDLSIMFEVINYRYLKRLPIMVSSEYGIDKLLEFDEAVGSRIMEMCKGFIVEFPQDPQLNYRLVV
jgi:DNA replication protein DnaC